MLFSFLLITYNQEQYIENALRSLLTQDYDDLEIVVSDDNSSDRTFEIAQKMVAEYRGPFKVILNKNETNLGIGQNFFKAYSLSHGDWLFMAAGDDISYPDRARYLEQMINAYPGALGFGAIRNIIDAEGKSLGFCTWHKIIHGASATWHRSLFSEFPPISKGNMSEDWILFFRIFLLNGCAVQLFRPVVHYRIDGKTVSNKKSCNIIESKKYYLRKLKYYKNILYNMKNDLESGKRRLDDNFFKELSIHIENEFSRTNTKIIHIRYFFKLINLNLCNRVKTYLFLRKKKNISFHDILLIEIVVHKIAYYMFSVLYFKRKKRNFESEYTPCPPLLVSVKDFRDGKFI